MLPTRLNLLSPEKKRYLLQMINFQFIRSLSEIILIFITLITIAIIGSRTILEQHLTSLAESINSINKQQSGVSRKIQTINHTLQAIEKIQPQHTLWSQEISKLANQLPAGIVINNLRLNKPQKIYLLSGVAKTRNDLLALEEKLKTFPEVKTVEAPLSQLTQKENIEFNLTIHLN